MIFFSLEPTAKPKIIKVIQIVFGVVCFVIAICWIFINVNRGIFHFSASYPILFLFLFGFYEVMSGLGYTDRFISIEDDRIKLKQNAIIPHSTILLSKLKSIRIFPLSIEFILDNKHEKVKRFHFGTNYSEIIVPIKEKIVELSEQNNIELSFESEI